MSLVYAVKDPGQILTYPVKAGEKIQAGQCVGIGANGYAYNYVKTLAGTYKKTFIAVNSIDNTNGQDGVLTDTLAERCINVYGYGARLIVKSSGLSQAKVLNDVYGGVNEISDTRTASEVRLGILTAYYLNNSAEILIQ